MAQWARNKLNKHPDGIAELTPASVVELADFIGCSHQDLAAYLAGFLPDSTEDGDAKGRALMGSGVSVSPLLSPCRGNLSRPA